MLRRISLLTVALVALLTGTALAHPGHLVLHAEKVQAGPYTLTVEHNQWPIRARTNVDLVVLFDNVPADAKVVVRLVPPQGSTVVGRTTLLVSHPSIPGAWTVYNYALAAPGEWALEFQVDGPSGRGVGTTQPMPVAGPPGMPLWMGWTLGFAPAIGFGGFMLREWRRVRAAIALDGGARS